VGGGFKVGGHVVEESGVVWNKALLLLWSSVLLLLLLLLHQGRRWEDAEKCERGDGVAVTRPARGGRWGDRS
jgi:hypothetical protein